MEAIKKIPFLRKLGDKYNLASNMGWRYVAFRSKYELLSRSGLLKFKFPVKAHPVALPTLAEWKLLNIHFFFNSKEDIQLPRKRHPGLLARFRDIEKGKFTFFGHTTFNLGDNYNWVTNPDTGYVYDIKKHWTEIADLAKEAGDIKYVWEKSRFSFLYDIIRYDYHFSENCSGMVFKEIISWIDCNPINCGPNYRCSQEITLRLFNWLFALYYYKNSASLTEEMFNRIMFSIYQQARHVYSNIHFSRIAVRNNHALTETLGLYVFGLLLPFCPEAQKWKRKGKRWFEQEVAYQIYPDGTFLQFSMNYHRVAVQLLTWGIRLSELHNESLDKVVRERGKKSLDFLFNCMNSCDGRLPNYGANDGALFFPLNDCHFLDYRPQLDALAAVLNDDLIDGNTEDRYWYGFTAGDGRIRTPQDGAASYPVGGFYLLKEACSFSFIRCGAHRDRPSQADNLHLDLWVKGTNVLRDGGSYRYNSDEPTLNYFFGTESHNTVMLGDNSQMKRGGRFIWYYWSQSVAGGWTETDRYYEFKGTIKAFTQLGDGILHIRTVRKFKHMYKWEITDKVLHNTGLVVRQLWHPASVPGFEIIFASTDESGKLLPEENKMGWYSSMYGAKESAQTIIFSSDTSEIRTTIELSEVME